MVLAMPALWGIGAGGCGARSIRSAPDVIHSNGLKSHLLVSQTRRPAGCVAHHDFVSARPMIAVCCDDARASYTDRHLAGDRRRRARLAAGSSPEVILNGVDLERFAPGSGDGVQLDALAGLAAAEPGTIRVGWSRLMGDGRVRMFSCARG